MSIVLWCCLLSPSNGFRVNASQELIRVLKGLKLPLRYIVLFKKGKYLLSLILNQIPFQTLSEKINPSEENHCNLDLHWGINIPIPNLGIFSKPSAKSHSFSWLLQWTICSKSFYQCDLLHFIFVLHCHYLKPPNPCPTRKQLWRKVGSQAHSEVAEASISS